MNFNRSPRLMLLPVPRSTRGAARVFLVRQVAQALGDGGALVSYGGMSLRPITLPAALLQVE